MNKKLLKLAALVMKFAEIPTDKGPLVIEGDIEVGVEVFVLAEDGEYIPAPDDIYALEDGRAILIQEGKVVEIQEAPKEEAPVEDVVEEVLEEEIPVEEPKDDKVAELEAKIAELEALVAEKDEKIQALEGEINDLKQKPVEEAIEMSAVAKPIEAISGALKYFN
jgi:uncharacterized coiled-coil protein SlyX